LAAQLLQVNLMLVVFNLIPAFPMDGGRILRALLGMKFSHTTATLIAARVGQVMAALFVVAGIFFGNPFLVFIGIFVFSGAQAELSFAKMRAATTERTVGEAMITRFQSFLGSQPVFEAAAEAARDSQPIFPVTDDRLRVTGMVRRKDLLASGPAGAATVAQLASAVPTVGVETVFGEAYGVMQGSGNSVLPVVNAAGQVVGLISMNLISQSARS
jgi:CBS domain-containing protein